MLSFVQKQNKICLKVKTPCWAASGMSTEDRERSSVTKASVKSNL